MRESVNKANSLFAKIFDHSIMIILSGRVRQEGRESLYKGKRLQRVTMGQWKRERGQDEEETFYIKNPRRVGPPSRRSTPVHVMEDRIPHLSLNIGFSLRP